MTSGRWNLWLGVGLAAMLAAGCGGPGALPTAVGPPAGALAARHVLDVAVPLIPKHMASHSASSERKGMIYGKYSADRALRGGDTTNWDKEWATAGTGAREAWLAVNFDGTYNVTAMTIKTNKLADSHYLVESTTDGVTWTPVKAGLQAGDNFQTETVTFDKPVTATGMRIHWYNGDVFTIDYFAIFGLQYYGIPADTSSTGSWNLGPGGGIPGVV